jgi:hypothetical protein
MTDEIFKLLSNSEKIESISETLKNYATSQWIEELDRSQRYLIEGKTFLNDSDAAVLGRACAIYVSQFRFSFVELSAYLRMLPQFASATPPPSIETVRRMVDGFINSGQDLLIALVSLEKFCSIISKKSLFHLTTETIRS